MNNYTVFDEMMDSIAIRLNTLSEADHDETWQESDAHADYNLWLPLAGSVVVEYEEGQALVRPGEAFFFTKGRHYSARVNGGSCRFCYVSFDFALGQDRNALDEFEMMGPVPAAALAPALPAFWEAYRQVRERQPLSIMLLRGDLYALLALVFRYFLESRATRPLDLPDSRVNRLKPVLTYIRVHIDKLPDMRELAAMARMSPKYFYTYFKKVMYVTPGEYIHRLKMDAALYYLDRGLGIREIAEKLGYADSFSFSKAFKRSFGVPPTKYR